MTPFSAFAEDESGEYEYEFERTSIKTAIREAIAEGALDLDLKVIGTYADEYADLLEADGSLYEVFPEAIDEDRDRDRALDLRIFARIEGSIPVDDTYVFDGSEELIFLLENKTDQIQTAAIGIDGMWTDEIEVLPAASVAVDGESGGPGVVSVAAAAETDAAVAGDTVISGDSAISGGSMSGSGGSSGGSGSSGSSSGSSGSSGSVGGSKSESADETVSGSESDLTGKDADEFINGDAVENSAQNNTGFDDSDRTGENQSAKSDIPDDNPADITDGQKSEDDANSSVTDDIDDTTEDGLETSGANADAETGESDVDNADEADTGNTSGEKAENGSDNNSVEAGETSDENDKTSDDEEDIGGGSADAAGSDNGSGESSSSDTGSGSGESSGSDTGSSSSEKDSSDTDSNGESDSAGSSSDHDNTDGRVASISLHRTAYLSASLASASDAGSVSGSTQAASGSIEETGTGTNIEKRATPSDATASDAEHSIDGELLNAVLIDGHGAVAFVTTAADLKLDVIMLSEQEMTCESEDGDQDYLVTVTGWLPDGGYVTAEPVDVEIEGKTVLLALDISIYDDNGEIYEPAEDTISVKITSSEIASEESGSNYDVYYVPEEGEPELVPVTESEEGDVTFEAEHFSVYAVTSSDTVIASGTIDNGEGEEDAISWVIYEDDAGNRYLLIEGEGSIPDYSSEDAGQPWYSYRSTVSTLILGEGITRVGKQAFHGNYFTDIEFSDTVTSIGSYAFSYSQKLTSVTIPGTITTIEEYAFAYSYHLYDVILEEGVTTIGNSAFGGNCGSSEDCTSVWITIPASVTSIGTYPFAMAAGYIVADGNTAFSADSDGVLYSYDGTTLVDYPKCRVAESWTIPEEVTTVRSAALQNVKYTKEIYVLHQVTLPSMAFRDSSGYTYVYIADDVSITGSLSYMFYNSNAASNNLTAVHLPENTALKIDSNWFTNCIMLTELKIPKGTTLIGGYAFSNTTNLETMYYDAAHVTSIASTIFGSSTMPLFDLTIGTNVDYLIADFSYILAHANSLTIEGPNAFYVDEGAFDSAPAPYTGLSGWVYVTEDGVVYTLDTETYEATLYYVPEDVTELIVPAEITDTLDGEDEVTFTVTTVAKDAVKDASKLTSITFEDASKITALEAYALANAPIESITDQSADDGAGSAVTTVSGAEALFTNAAIGYNAFYNTKLNGSVFAADFSSSMDGSTSITVVQMTIGVISGTTTEWVEVDEDDDTTIGGYSSLTGDAVQFNVSVSNTSGSEQTYRVYVQVTDDDCSLNYTAGNTYEVNGVTVTASETDDPYTICLEFTVAEGQTVNFSINALYATPTSDGGGVTVWGAIVGTNEEENETEEKTEGEIDACWTTLRDTYSVTKTNNNQASVSIAADDDGTIRPTSELKWQIELKSDGDQSDYGEDYVTTVTYTDVLTLPDGMEWDADILTAIKNGNVTIRSNSIYVGSTRIAALSWPSGSAPSGLSLSGVGVSYKEETGQVVLTWKIRNISSGNLITTTLNLTVYPAALAVNMTEYNTDVTNMITNTVDATVKYTYSLPDKKDAYVNKTVTGGAGAIKLSKSGTDVTYFGEDLTYTLKVYNDGGLPYTVSQAYTLTDALEANFYISAANMEKMFTEAADENTTLVITIANAKLSAEGKTETNTKGDADSALVNTGNSDLDETGGNSLAITYNSREKTYTVAANGDTGISGSNLEDLLQSLGYGVTSSVTYTCVWTLPMTSGTDDEGNTTTTFTLTGGSSYTYNIYATVKSTFQKLDQSDWPGQYPKTSPLTLNNNATLLSEDNKTKLTAKAASDTVIREAIINKNVSLDGVNLGSAPEASDGDVLDYTLTFTHYGDGSYDDLPMVDDIYGSQYLLVPVSKNSGITDAIWTAGTDGEIWSGTGVTTYDEDGDGTDDYYVLGIGEYSDVVIEQDADGNWLTAATVTVTSGADDTFEINGESYTWSGVHTQIKWYFEHLDGGDYTIEVSYKTLVDTVGYEAGYTIGNVVWMNDRNGSRIYASLWGGGTIIGYDKDIVVKEGANGDDDSDGLDDDKYTTISEGEKVTYRLTLESTGDSGAFVLNGANIADQLPLTYGVFDWTTENVKITNVIADTSGGGSVENEEALAADGSWSISDNYNGISGTGIWFIVWDNNVDVTFSGNAAVYIYVEVTYPSNGNASADSDDTAEDSGAADTNGTVTAWSDYVDEAKGTTLTNTFYVYRNPANVTHVLAEEGEATLQKGVYALARSTTNTSSSSSAYYYSTGTDRGYYNNQDSNYRYVIYYTSLYNGASTRLYLNDLYDQLPDGFTYVTLINSYSSGGYLANTHKITTLSSSNSLTGLLIQTDSDTTYMSAGISAGVADDGTLIFTVSSGSGDYAIKYDEEVGQYYLDKGEAIVFGYLCQIGVADNTEDTATNTIAMSYTDYTGAGVVKTDQAFKAREITPYDSNNDGNSGIENSPEVENTYGFDDGKGNSSWLVSTVDLTRGGIRPGVDKETVSYQTSTTSAAYTYTNSVLATDLVNWKITLINGGTMSIVDYTVTDIMPNPYVFTGDVAFTIYDSSGNSQGSGTLFTINTSPDNLQNLSVLNEDTLPSLSITPGGTTTVTEVSTDGTESSLTAKFGNTSVSFTLSFHFDDNGNLIMEIGMADTWMAIPEGGTIEITCTSWNPTTNQASTTYINQVTLTPTQSFTRSDIQSGSEVTDDSGNTTGVSALSPVTVTSGYATNAYKSVTEKENGGNTAVSTSSDNSIVLSSADKVFTYTLYVENVNEVAITKLVLIDNLPDEGDTYTYNDSLERNSDFSVSLNSDSFVVTITDADGNAETLDGGYIVEYSTKAGDFTEEDRSGASTWTELTSITNLSDVKSIRVILNTAIPAGATVSVSFDAEVSGEADPGAVAWNNFGYRYNIETGSTTIELEAMPLVVGVKIPSAPELTKELVGLNGIAYEADNDDIFTFVIYKGEEVKDSDWKSYTNQSDLTDALYSNNTDYKVVTVNIMASSSQSDKLVMTGSNGLTDGNIWWTWENGVQYTIAEFLESDNYYSLKEWDSGNTTLTTSNSCTFTYDLATTLSLTCVNTCNVWDLTLTKVDEDSYNESEETYDSKLAGAVFALYSKTEPGSVVASGYGADSSITVEGEEWHFVGEELTDKDGVITWTNLTEESYCLVEVKAPDGYNLNPVPVKINRESNHEEVTVTNKAGTILPESGGPGTLPFRVAGLLLMSVSAYLIFDTLKRRRISAS